MTEQQIQAAFDEVTNQVYAPVFFEKLAQEYGMIPETQEEAVQMLVQAAHVKAAALQQIEKEPKQLGNTLLKTANQVLGLDSYEEKDENLIGQAASELLKNEKLASAVKSLCVLANEQNTEGGES